MKEAIKYYLSKKNSGVATTVKSGENITIFSKTYELDYASDIPTVVEKAASVVAVFTKTELNNLIDKEVEDVQMLRDFKTSL